MSLTFALQALLTRHEAYIAEASEERRKMVRSFDKLENGKKESEASNVRIIEENRYLLDQLEEMNSTVVNSDAQILSLNATLQSTRKELERLTVLAARTSHLEAQLASLESEAADLHHQLASREEKEQTAVQRWKGAERTISALQEQLDRIDQEAREERLRHAEVVKRFERRRAVERELENAAGRLKRTEAATAPGQDDGSNSVVSHFVKDILQDNANLQLGIVELREMLLGSNEEVENLREQMMLHQPIQPHPERPGSGRDLKSDLARTPTNEAVLSPDFHVHHHYHAAPKVKTARERPVGLARTKKRRNITSPGLRTPSSGTQTPRTPRTPSAPSMQIRTGSSAANILSQTSVTIPPIQSHRWSSQSSQAPSSLPSSPQSAFRNPSVFDTMDDNMYSSRPTTPGSTALESPSIYTRHSKRNSDVSTRNLSMQTWPNIPQSISRVLAADRHGMDDSRETIKFPLLDHSTILEEAEDDTTISFLDNHFDPYKNAQQPHSSMEQMRSRLHRASSHESILSSRGIEIPKLRGKRSQGFNPRSSFGPSVASIGPVTSSTAAVAQASKRDRSYDSSNYNRLLLSHASTNPAAPAPITTAGKSTLGKRVGGWVFGKWGVAPAKSTGNLRAIDALSSAFDEGSVDKKKGGSVRGRKTENRLSTHVEAVTIDSTLLQESLDG